MATCCLLLSAPSIAQPEAINTSFNPTDIGFGFVGGAAGTVRTTSLQNDGKIIIGGSFTSSSFIRAFVAFFYKSVAVEYCVLNLTCQQVLV